MNKFNLLLLAIILLSGCSISSRSASVAPRKEYDPNALYYYSMAEAALQMKDLNSAASLFRKASTYEPESIEIKERLLEVLSIQANYDPQINSEIIEIGESCIARKDCPNTIRIILAEACSFAGDLEKGDLYLKQALDHEPSMNLYLSYYLFRKNQMQDDDITLLETALQEKWDDLQTVMMIAELYGAINPDSSLIILDKAYDIWSEERVLRPILAFHEQRGETALLVNKIQQHLDAKRPASDFLKETLISIYFRARNFQAVVDNQDICLELDKDPVLRYLFFSAMSLKKNDLALSTAKIIEQKADLPEEIKPLFHAYYGYVLFAQKDFQSSGKQFLLTNNINLVLDIITELGMASDIGASDLKEFAEALLAESEQPDMAHFLSGFLYALIDDKGNSEEYLSRVSFEFLQENGLVESAAILLLNVNETDLARVEELLSKRKDKIPSFNEIAGFYFYNEGQDSIAYNYFNAEIEDSPAPSRRLISAAVIIAEKRQDIDFITRALDISLQLYEDDPEILNLFGYTIADMAIEAEYERAERMLTSAIDAAPDNLMYWDSLAWLYFRMGKYEKALAAMEKPLSMEINNSEIAYHLGEIFLKAADRENARKYLELAVELDNDSDAVNLSRKLLQDFSDFKEK